MPRPSPLTWLPLWERALDPSVEIGIAFRVDGVTREYFRNTLYEAKKLSGDPKFDDLIMFLPGGSVKEEIWICKREVQIDD